MSAKSACSACRARKVKCVSGQGPRCERCTTLGYKDCIYVSIKKRGVGTTLRTGAACKRCRTSKRKCDGKRPCTTCVKAKRSSECEFRMVDVPPSLLNHLQFVFWNEPDSSASRGVSPRESWVVAESSTKPQITTVIQPALKMVPSELSHVQTLSRNSTPPSTPLDQSQPPSPEQAHHLPPVILPEFSRLLSRVSPRILPEPHLTLLSLGAKRFQLSDTATDELDMKFRISALCRLNKMGIRFTSRRQRAMLHGDTSGSVIHPFFVHSAQSMGMYFCEGMANLPAMIRLQAKHLQRALECLAEVFKGEDWELRAQVALWVTSSSMTLSIDGYTFLFMQRCCEAVDTAGLRFIPVYGRPPLFSEELHEQLVVLSQIIYFENFLFLMCNGEEPTMTGRIEKEFRHQLPQIYPVLFKICPLTMRTKTILLVRDTVVMLARQPTDEAQIGIWRHSCDQLVFLLNDYSQNLLANLRRFKELGDKSGAEMIRDCCVNCFAHLAVLCEVLCKLEPASHAGIDSLCDSSLERLGELTQDTCMEEYSRHDLLLRASWGKAVGVFKARLANTNLRDDTILRRYEEIVTGLYLDFVARVPNAGPPALARMMSRRVDGRTEGSRYPNLILPQERRKYGI